MQTVEDFELDLVQLDGNESPDLCEEISSEVEVIKTFKIENGQSVDKLIKDYDDACDYYSFETAPKKGIGSNGEKFDWKLVSSSKIEKPFFLNGGIKPGDEELIKDFKHPDFYGVGLNSHFEKEPGLKDMGLILQFMHGLKRLKLI